MNCKDREENIIEGNLSQDKILSFLYETHGGRTILKPLVKPTFSKICGWILNSGISASIIKSFVKKNSINLDEYEGYPYKSYNDFFIRKLKHGRRPIDMDYSHLISPCDSRLSVYKIDGESKFSIKDTLYTMESLTRSKKIADAYKDGVLMVFRLSVEDYHRYSYVDWGTKSKNYRIKGIFHTVNPLANDVIPIYKENERVISILKSENFGPIIMMEVGALIVGKIINYLGEGKVERGQEKGRFEFGGSTVILAFKKDKIVLDEDILANSSKGIETKVRLGEKIGVKA